MYLQLYGNVNGVACQILAKNVIHSSVPRNHSIFSVVAFDTLLHYCMHATHHLFYAAALPACAAYVYLQTFAAKLAEGFARENIDGETLYRSKLEKSDFAIERIISGRPEEW